MTTEVEDADRQTEVNAARGLRGAGEALGAAGEKLQENPVSMLMGGLALGVLIGALLPRSEREMALLGSLGERIGDAAREAMGAARATGQEKLDELGLTRDGAREKVQTLIDSALHAATAAGNAAKASLRGGDEPSSPHS
jgi:hypothetical protein